MLNFSKGKANIKYIFILIIISVIIGGFLVFEIQISSCPGRLYQFSQINISKDNSSSTILATGDWQTYRNEEYGFEIKYPEGAKIQHMTEAFYGGNNGILDWIKILNIPNTSSEITADKNLNIIISDNPYAEKIEETVNISNLQFNKTTWNDIESGGKCCIDDHESYTTIRNNIYFNLDFQLYISKSSITPEFNPLDNEKNIYNQMLSTFRFIK